MDGPSFSTTYNLSYNIIISQLFQQQKGNYCILYHEGPLQCSYNHVNTLACGIHLISLTYLLVGPST